jgi:hypothetical protein
MAKEKQVEVDADLTCEEQEEEGTSQESQASVYPSQQDTDFGVLDFSAASDALTEQKNRTKRGVYQKYSDTDR